MSVLMVFRIAFKALGRNKMRTALTMLGMIIGVAAVITMVALGTGAQSSIESQIQSAGTNMIIVITAATPIIMPSIVRAVRILLRFSALTAIRRIIRNDIASP